MTRTAGAGPAPGPGWPRGEVRVWRVPLAARPDDADLDLLADDERGRAEAMAAPGARTGFVAARAGLRRILGVALERDPRALRFALGAHGKPRLAAAAGAPDPARGLAFNVAHTAGLALIAVTAGARVGVDVERADRALDWAPVARRFLSERERAALAALPAAARARAFLACWTRKEAFVKALGAGVAAGLGRFDASVDPEAPAALLGCRMQGVDPRGWTLLDLDAGPAHLAALAVEAPGARVRYCEVSTSTISTGESPGGRSP